MLEELHEAVRLADTEPDQALTICSKVIDESLDGMDAQQALFIYGHVLMKAERFGMAYNTYQRCAQLRPDQAEIYNNMGMCVEMSRPHEAIKLFQKAQKLDPSYAKAYANEGLIALHSANPDRCIHLSDKCLHLDNTSESAKQNKSLALLMNRDWKKGWQLFFETLGVDSRQKRDYGVPDWTPESEPGTVVVYGEQGVGDEIMYASCIEGLVGDGFDVVIDTDPRLELLFRRSFSGCTVYGDRFTDRARAIDNHTLDYQCAIGQLPAKYRLTEGSFPGRPYLEVDKDRAIGWRAIFDSYKGKTIGVAWSGGNPNTMKHKRTFDPSHMSELFDTDNTFVCLEYNPVPDDVIHKYGLKCFPDITAKGKSLDHLAAMISQLDVVVTACTTVVYIAGALGVECHVLVPREPGYRYHKKGEKFPWYSSVKLHRFNKNWKNTVRGVIKCLGVS